MAMPCCGMACACMRTCVLCVCVHPADPPHTRLLLLLLLLCRQGQVGHPEPQGAGGETAVGGASMHAPLAGKAAPTQLGVEAAAQQDTSGDEGALAKLVLYCHIGIVLDTIGRHITRRRRRRRLWRAAGHEPWLTVAEQAGSEPCKCRFELQPSPRDPIPPYGLQPSSSPPTPSHTHAPSPPDWLQELVAVFKSELQARRKAHFFKRAAILMVVLCFLLIAANAASVSACGNWVWGLGHWPPAQPRWAPVAVPALADAPVDGGGLCTALPPGRQPHTLSSVPPSVPSWFLSRPL